MCARGASAFESSLRKIAHFLTRREKAVGMVLSIEQ